MSILGKLSKDGALAPVSSTQLTTNTIDSTVIEIEKSISTESSSDFPPEVIDSMTEEETVITTVADPSFLVINEDLVSAIESGDSSEDTEVVTQFRQSESTLGTITDTPDTTSTQTEVVFGVAQTVEETRLVLAEVSEEGLPDRSTEGDFLPGEDLIGEIGGEEFLPSQKPGILAILAESVSPDGFPKRSVLFIKRVDLLRYEEVEYRILRKNIFIEDEYKIVGKIDKNFKVDERYKKIAEKNLGIVPVNGLISFVDSDFKKNMSYAYKIELSYKRRANSEVESLIKTFGSFNDFVGRIGLGVLTGTSGGE